MATYRLTQASPDGMPGDVIVKPDDFVPSCSWTAIDAAAEVALVAHIKAREVVREAVRAADVASHVNWLAERDGVQTDAAAVGAAEIARLEADNDALRAVLVQHDADPVEFHPEE